MTLEDFAALTRNVIRRDGFDNYLPTVVYPSRRQVSVLEGVPDDIDVEEAAWRWATGGAAEGEEFLVAFKVDEVRFKIVRKHPRGVEHGVFYALGKDA